MSDATGSITRLIAPLRAGDPAAQEAAFARLWGSAFGVARRRSTSPANDAEDVAIQAIHQLLTGFENGSFPAVQRRGDLFALLWEIVARRLISERRKATAARRDARRQETLIGDPRSPAPSPAELVAAREHWDRQLARLEEAGLRRFVEESIAGWTIPEIAAHLGCSIRTVDRKLALARTMLESEVRDG
jgi:DNA-directed RNA polymerase specialized sigma24 family protein